MLQYIRTPVVMENIIEAVEQRFQITYNNRCISIHWDNRRNKVIVENYNVYYLTTPNRDRITLRDALTDMDLHRFQITIDWTEDNNLHDSIENFLDTSIKYLPVSQLTIRE
jgi:hypothetical protein